MSVQEIKERNIKTQLAHISEWFKTHKAQWLEGPKDGASVLKWERPDSNIYSVNYIFLDRSLAIVGDIGDAVYEFSSPIGPKNFTTDFHYFQTKLRASGDTKEWNVEIAKASLEAEAQEYPNYAKDILEGLEHIENLFTWQQFLLDAPAFFTDDLTSYYEIGSVETIRHRAYLVGINEAAKQLWSN